MSADVRPRNLGLEATMILLRAFRSAGCVGDLLEGSNLAKSEFAEESLSRNS